MRGNRVRIGVRPLEAAFRKPASRLGVDVLDRELEEHQPAPAVDHLA
jgi:hypothetical protein